MSKKQDLKREYMHERKRIQNYISRNKKKGYVFPDDTLPQIPKRITQSSINRLKKLNASELLDRSYALVNIPNETGQGTPEYMPGSEARKHYRSNIVKGEAFVDYFDTPTESVSVPKGMTDAIAKTFGFNTVKDMQTSQTGKDMLSAINQLATNQSNASMDEPEAEPADLTNISTNFTPKELTGLGKGDMDLAQVMKSKDERSIAKADQYTEGAIIFQRLQNHVESFDSVGSDILKRFYANSINKYGTDAVYRTLHDLQQTNPDAIKELDEFRKKYRKGSDTGAVNRAFRYLADAFKMNATGDPNYKKRLGRAIEAMEVFDVAVAD